MSVPFAEGVNALVTSAPLLVTLSTPELIVPGGAVTSISASPSLMRSARLDRVRISNGVLSPLPLSDCESDPPPPPQAASKGCQGAGAQAPRGKARP